MVGIQRVADREAIKVGKWWEGKVLPELRHATVDRRPSINEAIGLFSVANDGFTVVTLSRPQYSQRYRAFSAIRTIFGLHFWLRPSEVKATPVDIQRRRQHCHEHPPAKSNRRTTASSFRACSGV
jgi:hypothetical protein